MSKNNKGEALTEATAAGGGRYQKRQQQREGVNRNYSEEAVYYLKN